MLQVFYLNVIKVDLDIVYTCMLQVYVSSVSGVLSECCICLHLLSSVSDVWCNCFGCFEHMLQVFYLNVVKVDIVLNMQQWDHLSQPPIAAARAPLSRRKRSPRACAWEAKEMRAIPVCGRVAWPPR